MHNLITKWAVIAWDLAKTMGIQWDWNKGWEENLRAYEEEGKGWVFKNEFLNDMNIAAGLNPKERDMLFYFHLSCSEKLNKKIEDLYHQ